MIQILVLKMKHYFMIIGVAILSTTFCWGAHIEVKNVTTEIQARSSPLSSPSSSSSSSECSCKENSSVDPVCGSDGATYINLNQLECLKKCKPELKYAYSGPCFGEAGLGQSTAYEYSDTADRFGKPQKECLCDIDINANYELYCGNDGQTYTSKTVMDCTRKCFNPKLEVKYRGACENQANVIQPAIHQEERPPCICSIPFKPPQIICGSDGQSYGTSTYIFCQNKCFNKKLEEKHPGTCVLELFERKLSFMDFLKTIKPHIFMRLTALEQACVAKCPATIVKKPVCGTDGVTYENPLQVDCARNCYNRDLSVDYEGECRYSLTNELKECACSMPTNSPLNPPVCGSDGRTYPNEQALKCLSACKNDITLIKLDDGSC